MSDGANIGVGPSRALKTILGGAPQPTEAECEGVEEMRARILSAPISGTESYDGCALACARLIIEAWAKWPPLAELPPEAVYLVDAKGAPVLIKNAPVTLVPGLYHALKQVYRDRQDALEVFSNLTGFMWGWSLNAALRCIDQPPVPNPAFMTIGERPEPGTEGGE